MRVPTFCLVILSVILVVFGIVVIALSRSLLRFLVRSNLVLSGDSNTFELWRRFPTLVATDFYFFNWTNSQEIYNLSAKPRFEQVGPYRFWVRMEKQDITWNRNGTVTFRPVKYYYYDEERENGDLQDRVTTLNPVSVAVAHASRNWNYLLRKGISFTLSTMTPTLNITQTVDEFLFAGYLDHLTGVPSAIPFLGDPDMGKFGWFYKRNGSNPYNGFFNIGTGVGTTFSQLYQWNYESQTSFYQDDCSYINGTTGENFGPDTPETYIKIFSPEVCRLLTLEYVGKVEAQGVVGNKYILGSYMLDNGTKFKENRCSCNGECLPSGLFNVSSCRQGTPAFGSLPNFNRADPYYVDLVEGIRPDPDKHDFYVIVEPNTGMPLEVRVRLQVNLMLRPVPGIKIYEGAPRIFFPVLYFDQKVEIPKATLSTIQKVLSIPWVCRGVGIAVIVIGSIWLIYLVVVKNAKVFRKKSTATGVRYQKEGSVVSEQEQKYLL